MFQFIYLFAFVLAAHDYHVGIYEIDIVEGRFQISMKLFTDDFELAMKQNQEDFLFSEENDSEAFREKVSTYIASKFRIEINGENLPLDFLGMEWEDHHVVYLYWESEKSDFTDEFTLYNRIFLDVAPEQINMHRIAKGQYKISVPLEKGKYYKEIQMQ